MYTYLRQALLRVLIHRTQVVKKWKLRARFSPTKENRTKISTHTDQDGFLCAVFRSRLDQKSRVTKCLVCFVCDLFPMSKSMLRMGSFLYLFVFVDVIFYSFALSAAKVALGHCSRVSLL